ncbi:MAG TPA: serine hydrolase [Flavisolibacter sp.]|jgi:CubicO group peptidase (beta-lactamase class C family)
MKKIITLLFIAFFAVSCKPKAQVKSAVQISADTKELDSILAHFSKADLFQGVVLVATDDKVLLNKGYGWADAATQKPNDPSLLYQIGSVTKQFTAAAILKLQEEGKLSVNDTISKYFPKLKEGRRITIRHMLTHTSGLFNYTNDTTFWMHEAAMPSSHEKMMSRFADKPLDFEPGTRFSYSNSGYVLLGYIIEQVSGKPYEQYIRENIFRPLGMNRSGFDFTKATNRATGYYVGGVSEPAMIVDSTGSYAAGSIYTTTSDLFKWVQAMHHKKLLKPGSWEQAFTPFKGQYGYGLIMDKMYGQKRIWHNGGIHGFVSNLEYFPESNTTVILISNYMHSDLARVSRTIDAALFGKPYELPKVRKEIKLAETTLKQYEGTYALTNDFAITVKAEGGKLTAQATGQGAYEIFPEKEDHFFYKVVDAQIVFEKDATGKILALTLFQNGAEMRGKKVQ